MKRLKPFLLFVLVSCISFAQTNIDYNFEMTQYENELYWTSSNELTHSLDLTSSSLKINLSQERESFDAVSLIAMNQDPLIGRTVFDFTNSKKLTTRITNHSDSVLKIVIVPIDSSDRTIYATKDAQNTNYWEHDINWIIQPHETKYIKNYDFEGALVMDWNTQQLENTFEWDKVMSVLIFVKGENTLEYDLTDIDIEIDIFKFGLSIDDEDNDGVIDELDLCLGSISGADVDINGCEFVPFSHFEEDFTKTEFENGFYWWSKVDGAYEFTRTGAGLLVEVNQEANMFDPLILFPTISESEYQNGDFRGPKFLNAKVTNLGKDTLFMTIAPVDSLGEVIYASSGVKTDSFNWFNYDISWLIFPGETVVIDNYDFDGSVNMDWGQNPPVIKDNFNWNSVQSLYLTFRDPSYVEAALGQSVLIQEISFGKSKVSIVDEDKDGVTDSLDFCPNTPTGVDVDINGCSVVTGVTDLLGMELVYPNPFTTVLNIDFVGFYTLKDVQGKVVLSGHVNFETIDVSVLTNGLYTLSLQNDTQSVSFKLMK